MISYSPQIVYDALAMTSEEDTLVALTEEQIEIATVDDLRAAYRALAAHHGEIQQRLAAQAAASVAAVQELRARGKATGEAPYGFWADRSGTLRKEPDEQRVIRRVKRLRAKGYSYSAIAKLLNNGEMKPREGKKFHPTQIVRIVAAAGKEPPIET